MKAGRETDAVVAEKIMGVQIPGWLEIPDGLSTMTSYEIVSPYSTNIGAAWQVVEVMHAKGFNVSITADHGWRTRWECCVMLPGGDRPNCKDADTAPLAICLAALFAVGHEEPTP